MSHNVLGLCVRAGNRSTKAKFITKVAVEFCTSTRLTQNPCSSDTFGEDASHPFIRFFVFHKNN
jgi:hypothetical protein